MFLIDIFPYFNCFNLFKTNVTQSVKPMNYTLFFFYKNLFYKNVEAEIDPNFKNVLKTFLRLRVD